MATKPRRDKQARIIDAALRLSEERGWTAITLDDIATAAKLDIDEVYRLTPTKSAVLNAYVRRTDLAVLEVQSSVDDEEAEASTHDRLFDVLMRRFEVLLPDRAALGMLCRDLPRDPVSLVAVLPQAHCSFGRMLEAAGVSTKGLRGLARIHAIAAVWMATQRTWFSDEGEDMARTMAVLDRNLRRMEETAGLVLGLRSAGKTSET
ncbi:MAG: helix-turn-helix domain containing protein [Alphaproteobacteria bacterium]|nr:helix-turn-helix domain containing protein [Alphaproteobacteria bacterium]MCZ6589848.1 helix-turn-helix domain containing protein [Alphaproteobacteria bacterium]MCZ6846726.1 helix-turn-helix domain containing protein [Alphaproteobacteria bacterium]